MNADLLAISAALFKYVAFGRSIFILDDIFAIHKKPNKPLTRLGFRTQSGSYGARLRIMLFRIIPRSCYLLSGRFFLFLSLLFLCSISVNAQECAEALFEEPLQQKISELVDQTDDYSTMIDLVSEQGEVGEVLSRYLQYIASLKDGEVFEQPAVNLAKNIKNYTLNYSLLTFSGAPPVEYQDEEFRNAVGELLAIQEKYCIFDESNPLINKLGFLHFLTSSSLDLLNSGSWRRASRNTRYLAIYSVYKNAGEKYRELLMASERKGFDVEIEFWASQKTLNFCHGSYERSDCADELVKFAEDQNLTFDESEWDKLLCDVFIYNAEKIYRFAACE